MEEPMAKLSSQPLSIMIAGPYRSGTGDDPALIAANLRAMNEVALQIYRAGHIPVVGEWFALPLVETAGSTQLGDAIFNEIFHPIAWAVSQRCDATFRLPGASQGADEMVRLAESLGQPVFYRIEDLPA
jgi:hypothetical protein